MTQTQKTVRRHKRIGGALNYQWRWDIIPNYILRWHTEKEQWVPNLLLQGLITTIRVSLYAWPEPT